MWYSAPPELVAAIDLGSNSFHMVIARLRAGELVILDGMREMVRLAAGLSEARNLTDDAQQRALSCLERFGQRVRHMPPGSVRAVGTNTLRIARNAEQFIEKAEAALGHPIEIISGMEEARLIYLGVAQSLAPDGKRRMIMDIGGGSTEFIIGVDREPLHMESSYMGCVSMSGRFFGDGRITAKRFKRAVIMAEQQLEPFQQTFRNDGWDEAVGASGTLRTAQKIVLAAGWSKDGITGESLTRLVDSMIAAGHVDKLQWPDLSPERAPVFPGGLAILYSAFKALGIQQMKVSDGALREGLLYDLLGRIFHEDVRIYSVAALASRYHVDQQQVKRVRDAVNSLLRQVSFAEDVDRETAAQWLGWAADLHEIGRDIAHSQYHKHGAYIARHADLPGFSHQDQKLLAALVQSHRRKFPLKQFKDLAPPWHKAAKPLAVILRLAVLLNRSRQADTVPEIGLALTDRSVDVKFPPTWLDSHPLTVADLEQEADYLKPAGLSLTFS